MNNTFSIEENARESKRLNALLDGGVRNELMKIKGVRSVSVGLKIKGSELIWERCFNLYVNRKIDTNELEKEQRIPEIIEGIITDVHEIEQVSLASPVAKGGVKISNGIDLLDTNTGRFLTTFGTLGAVGKDKGRSCNVVALTNWHVLYVGHNRVSVKKGTRIFQPNASTSTDNSGHAVPDPHTKDYDVGEVIDGIYNGTVDCAVFEVNRSCCNCCGVDYYNIIEGLEKISPLAFNGVTGTATAHAGDAVYFVGGVSGPSKGYVVDEAASLDTEYLSVMISDERIAPKSPPRPPGAIQTQHFAGQLKIRTDGNHPVNDNIPVGGISYSRFLEHGDSGSLLLNGENKAVGLMFATDHNPDPNNPPTGSIPNFPGVPPLPAGSPNITLYGYANHYADVISALKNAGVDFEINYKQPSTGGSRGREIQTFAEPNSKIFQEWKEKIESHPKSKAISEAVTSHRDEVMMLINHCRPVTVKWHRSKGPAYAAVIMSNIREEKFEFPTILNEITATDLLSNMYKVLMEEGSNDLKQDLEKYGDKIVNAVKGNNTFEAVLSAIKGEIPVKGKEGSDYSNPSNNDIHG